MIRLLALACVLCVAATLPGCDTSGVAPDPQDPPVTDPFVSDSSLVTFVVQLGDSNMVAVAPFNDPQAYALLPTETWWWLSGFKQVWNPTFSPDKRWIYYGSALMARINLETLRVEAMSDDGFFRGSSRSLVWTDVGGILAGSREHQGLFYFPPNDTVATLWDRAVHTSFGSGPSGRLMTVLSGEPLGPYLLDPHTSARRPFPNSVVAALGLGASVSWDMHRLRWSEHNSLLVGDILDRRAGLHLFVADTLSNSITEYDDGFLDSAPAWGPQGWILFSRGERAGPLGLNQFGTIYLRHSTSGELRKWLGPESIPGAVGVESPDY